MGQRQKLWARRKRAELITLLGGCCQACNSVDELEIHTLQDDNVHHRLASDQRIGYYWRLHEERNILLLCQDCHQMLHHMQYEQRRHWESTLGAAKAVAVS